jgi:hypothetical protein
LGCPLLYPDRRGRKALYAKTRSEAAAMFAIAERDGPITLEPSKLLLSEYFAEWLASKKLQLAPETHRRYSSIVEGRPSPSLASTTSGAPPRP